MELDYVQITEIYLFICICNAPKSVLKCVNYLKKKKYTEGEYSCV